MAADTRDSGRGDDERESLPQDADAGFAGPALESALDAFRSHVAVLDGRGTVVATNAAWREFATLNGCDPEKVSEGTDYLQVCDRAAASGCEEAAKAAKAIRDLTAGQCEVVEFEYPCHSDGERRWFLCRGSAARDDAGVRVTLSHENITDERLAVLEAERRRELFETLALGGQAAVYTADAAGHARFHNRHLEELTGRSMDELEGLGWVSCVVPEDLAKARREWRQVLDSGAHRRFEARVVRPDGTTRWAEVRAALLPPSHAPDAVVGTIRDVTADRRLRDCMHAVSIELAALREDGLFRAAVARIAELLEVEMAMVAVFTGEEQQSARTLAVSIDGRPAADFEYDLAGTPCAELRGCETRVHADRVHQRFPEDRVVAELGVEAYAAVPLRDSADHPLGILAIASRRPFADPENIPPPLQVFAVRVAAEVERQRSERSFRDLIEFTPEALVLTDRGGAILLVNRRTEAMFGHARAELLGKPVEVLIPEAVRERHRGQRRLYRQNPVARTMGEDKARLWGQRRSGETFPVEVALQPIHTGDGVVFAAAVRDLTEQRRAEQTLRDSAADLERRVAERTLELERANRDLDEFSSTVSHDLRAPLHRIQGFGALLRESLAGRLTKEEAGFFETIDRSTLEMGQLIKDLLSAARSARAEMHTEVLDLTDLVHECIRTCSADLPGRRILFEAELLPRVRGDGTLIRQVLVNLIENAVKYSRPREESRVEIGCDGIYVGYATLFVRDNGIGFEMKDAERIFSMFQRLHGQDEFEGTGVGLATVARIVERHGGRIWAESVVGKGSTFRFTLPVAPAS